MIQVSQAFIDRMNTYTDFRNKAEIYLSDGTTLTLNSTKFNLTGNSLDDAGGVNTLPLGVAICRTISLNIDNSDEAYTSYDFYGAEIYLYMTFSTFPDVLLGKFTVTTPATYGDAITLSAVDDMWKANQPYTSELDYESGVSLRQIFVDACLSCDLMVGSTTFANNTYVVYKKPEGYTFREPFRICTRETPARQALKDIRKRLKVFKTKSFLSFSKVCAALSFRFIKEETSCRFIAGMDFSFMKVEFGGITKFSALIVVFWVKKKSLSAFIFTAKAVAS